MSALKSHDNDNQDAYVPNPWTGCLPAQTGNDEVNHYALHSSPPVNDLQQVNSTESSPRSWVSPAQLGPTPWEAATDQLHSRYHQFGPQLSGYLHSNGIPTSFPADALPMVPTQSFSGSDDGYQRTQSQTEPCSAAYHMSPKDSYYSTPESSHLLSPCSTTLSLPMEDGVLSSPGDDLNGQIPSILEPAGDDRYGKRKGAGASADSKSDEPYAQLIYQAFLSTERHAMTLQEIYQWFRENTDKGKDDSKGWQNSIRHNLSMNQVRVRAIPLRLGNN